MKKIVFLLACVLFSSLASADLPVPNQPAHVYVQPNDRRLFIQDRLPDGSLGTPHAYVMHGVNWSPTSVGTNPTANPNVFQQEFINHYQSDIQKMVQMGVNTVRVYHDFGTGPEAFQILDEFYRNGIKVIVQVDSPRHGVIADTANAATVVNAYKNHPAILMWAVGNEWDLKSFGKFYYIFNTIQEAAQFVNQTSQAIKLLDPNHPTTTLTIDPHAPGLHPLSMAMFPYLLPPLVQGVVSMEDIVNQMAPSIDVWGLNVYRNDSFQDVFKMWASISQKPAYIGEFGIDSYDHRVTAENQIMQRDIESGLWDELYFNLSAERFSGTSIGGLVFEWNDEWWKNGTPAAITVSGEGNGGQPDGFNDEEWFGILDVNRVPKLAFTNLQNRFLNGQAAVALNAAPVIRAISQKSGNYAQFQIGNKTVFSRSGGNGGARGLNVAVLDAHTGIRMLEVKSFDTWTGGSLHVKFQDFINYINSLPNGSIILIAVADEGGFISYYTNTFWNDTYVTQAVALCQQLGSQLIQQIKYNGAWAMISIKGQGKIAESVADPGTQAVAEAQVNLALDPDFDRRDITPPQIVITNPIPEFTNQAALVVNYTADGVAKQKSFNLNEGVNNLQITEIDLEGNQAVYPFSITLDTQLPSGSIVINGDDASTPSRDVILTLTAVDAGSGVGQISFSTDNQNTWTAWESFVSTKSITLPDESGTKEVFYRVQDAAGNSSIFSDTILLELSFFTVTTPLDLANVSAAGFRIEGTSSIPDVRISVKDYGHGGCPVPTFTVSNEPAVYDADHKTWYFNVLPSKITAGFDAVVIAQASQGEQHFSVERRVHVQNLGVPPPTNVTAQAVSSHAIQISWHYDNPQAGNQFNVETSLDGGSTYGPPSFAMALVPPITLHDWSWTNSSLEPNRTYYFQVRITVNSVPSEWVVVSATTPA